MAFISASGNKSLPASPQFASDDSNITHTVAAICGLSLSEGGKSPLLLAPILKQHICMNRPVPTDNFHTIFYDTVTRLKQLAPHLPNIGNRNQAQNSENPALKCLKTSAQVAPRSKVDRKVPKTWRKGSTKIFCKELSDFKQRHSSICTYSEELAAAGEKQNFNDRDSATTVNEEVSNNRSQQPSTSHMVHTTVEFTNILVPDMVEIVGAPYYWGRMNRHEAEAILGEKSEGTFLLRDSAHLNYLFSVSFRRYNRTLHARIEFQDHKYSFDRNDAGIFSAFSIVELIKHYKDPNRCLFFEPQLSRPLIRNFVFSLAEISRATVAANCASYASAGKLQLPISLKKFVQEFHHKQQLRVMHHDS